MKGLIISCFAAVAVSATAAANDFALAVSQTNIVSAVKLDSVALTCTAAGKLKALVAVTTMEQRGRNIRILPVELSQADIGDACKTNGVTFAKFTAVLMSLTEKAITK
jgi:hypothetical protein